MNSDSKAKDLGCPCGKHWGINAKCPLKVNSDNVEEILFKFGGTATWPSLFKYGKAKQEAKAALLALLEAEAIDVYWEGAPMGAVPLERIKELFDV